MVLGGRGRWSDVRTSTRDWSVSHRVSGHPVHGPGGTTRVAETGPLSGLRGPRVSTYDPCVGPSRRSLRPKVPPCEGRRGDWGRLGRQPQMEEVPDLDKREIQGPPSPSVVPGRRR